MSSCTGPRCIALPLVTTSRCASFWWSQGLLCLPWPTVTCRRPRISAKKWRKATPSALSFSMVWNWFDLTCIDYCINCPWVCPGYNWRNVFLTWESLFVLYIVLGIENRAAWVTHVNAASVCVPRNSYCQGRLQPQKTMTWYWSWQYQWLLTIKSSSSKASVLSEWCCNFAHKWTAPLLLRWPRGVQLWNKTPTDAGFFLRNQTWQAVTEKAAHAFELILLSSFVLLVLNLWF